jgi:hypothetical protein
MKRLLLVAISILSVAAILGPVPGVSAQQSDGRYKINLGARGPECQTEGYVAPKEIQVPAGDVTIDFVNQQPTKLEVQGIPGGTFLITGNSTVQKKVHAVQDITFTTWLQMQDCKKATGHIKVSAAGPQGGAFTWILVAGAIGTGLFFAYRSRSKNTQHQQSPPKETSSH